MQTKQTAQSTMTIRKSSRYLTAFLICVILGAAWQYRISQISTVTRRTSGRSQEPANLISSEPWSEATPSPIHTDNLATEESDVEVDVVSIQNAQALIDRGQIREGTAMLEKLIDMDPSNTQALMEMAMVFTLDLKEPQRSRQLLERILDVNPDHRAALNELELLYKELESVDDGLVFLAQKAEQHPTSLEIQYVYGRLLAATDPRGALPWLKRATFIADQKEQALDQLASAALRAGDLPLAIKSWAEALTLAEQDLERAKSAGEGGLDFIEDRISTTKLEISKAHEKLNSTTKQ